MQALQAITIAIIGSTILMSGALMVTLGRGSSGHESAGGIFILIGFIVLFIAAAQASLARASWTAAARMDEERLGAVHRPETAD